MAKRVLRRAILKRLRRAHHRGGHGVHSPFAFHLITQVIEEQRCNYYSYSEVEEIRNTFQWSEVTAFAPSCTPITPRKGQLLFRLTNHFKPTTLIEVGSAWGISTLYLQRGAPHATYHCIEPRPTVYRRAEQVLTLAHTTLHLHPHFEPLQLPMAGLQLLYINAHVYPTGGWEQQLLPYIGDRTVIVIDGIATGGEERTLWRSLQALEQVRVAFDIYDLGVLVCDSRLHKQYYRLSRKNI